MLQIRGYFALGEQNLGGARFMRKVQELGKIVKLLDLTSKVEMKQQGSWRKIMLKQ